MNDQIILRKIDNVDMSVSYTMERINAEDNMFDLLGQNRYEEANECLEVIIAVNQWFANRNDKQMEINIGWLLQ